MYFHCYMTYAVLEHYKSYWTTKTKSKPLSLTCLSLEDICFCFTEQLNITWLLRIFVVIMFLLVLCMWGFSVLFFPLPPFWSSYNCYPDHCFLNLDSHFIFTSTLYCYWFPWRQLHCCAVESNCFLVCMSACHT